MFSVFQDDENDVGQGFDLYSEDENNENNFDNNFENLTHKNKNNNNTNNRNKNRERYRNRQKYTKGTFSNIIKIIVYFDFV